MKNYYLVIVFLFSSFFMGYSQNTEEAVDSIPNVSLKVDSIEIRVVETNGVVYIYYFVHYSITNNSLKTITYTTNTCPSYNLISLTVKDLSLIYNVDVNCSINSTNYHSILPNKTIPISEEISSFSLDNIENEEYVKLSIPYVLRGTTLHRLSSYENDKMELTYQGKTIIVTHKVNENKVKKKK